MSLDPLLSNNMNGLNIVYDEIVKRAIGTLATSHGGLLTLIRRFGPDALLG